MRHAYATLGPLLGGQTWSGFMDEGGMPETLDFESPTAFPSVRTAQIRYTHLLEEGSYWAVAVEDPDSQVEPPAGVPGETEQVGPDLTARFNWEHTRGHVHLGLFAGMASFRPDGGSDDDVLLSGINLSTKFATFGEDSAIAQVTYGNGVGRYRGGITAAPDSNGDLEAVLVLGVLTSYERHWSKSYRSTLAYSWASGDLPSGASSDSTERVQYFATNLIWQFDARAWTGIEYHYGTRESFDGNDGDANRVQLSIKFEL